MLRAQKFAEIYFIYYSIRVFISCELQGEMAKTFR